MTLKNLVDHYFPESIGKPLENVQLGFIEFDADGKVTTTDLKFLITIVEGKRRKDWESSIFGDEQQRSVCSQSLSFRHDACKKELSWLSPVPEAWQSDRVISFDRVIGFQLIILGRHFQVFVVSGIVHFVNEVSSDQFSHSVGCRICFCIAFVWVC